MEVEDLNEDQSLHMDHDAWQAAHEHGAVEEKDG